jgi:hypothetical protein
VAPPKQNHVRRTMAFGDGLQSHRSRHRGRRVRERESEPACRRRQRRGWVGWVELARRLSSARGLGALSGTTLASCAPVPPRASALSPFYAARAAAAIQRFKRPERASSWAARSRVISARESWLTEECKGLPQPLQPRLRRYQCIAVLRNRRHCATDSGSAIDVRSSIHNTGESRTMFARWTGTKTTRKCRRMPAAGAL